MDFYPRTTDELIDAIIDVNSAGGSHTIHLVQGKVYLLNTIVDTDNAGASGLPEIAGSGVNLTIEGHGATLQRASTAPSFRFFHVQTGRTLELHDLTLRGGRIQQALAHGGAIRNWGTLTLVRCRLINNRVYDGGPPNGGYGGAVLNHTSGFVQISDSMILGSYAVNGGAIFSAGNLDIVRTQFIRNEGESGGALYLARRTPANDNSSTITNSVFQENLANSGGAVFGDSDMTIEDSLFLGNHARFNGAILQAPPSIDIFTSVINVNRNEFLENTNGNENSPNPLYSIDNEMTSNTIDATQNWWGANDGPSGEGDGSGEPVSINVDYNPYLVQPIEPDCDGSADCGFNYAANDSISTPNPISLRMGEKRLEVSDLQVNTPASLLEFRRTFRQSTLENTSIMGLGWSHNHLITMSISGITTSRRAEIHLPNGGELVLNETSVDQFVAVAGSTSSMVYNSGNDIYTLTGQDHSQYIFEEAYNGADTLYRLNERVWSNGESWNYSYITDSNYLDVIQDNYGNELRFSYYPSGSDPFVIGQLWRVGDRTSSGLDTTDPSGRYVEFSYVPERIGGQPISNPRALLAEISDVRGNTWSYQYYGQNLGEDIQSLANYLIARRSPAVDTTGDGIADETFVQERIQYTPRSELNINGDMESETGWSGLPDELYPILNERYDEEPLQGQYVRRVMADTNGQGIQSDITIDFLAGHLYEISAWVALISSGSVIMQIENESLFSQATLVSGWQQLYIDFVPTVNLSGRRLQFVAAGIESPPAVIEIYIDAVRIFESDPTNDSLIQERGIRQSALTEALLTTEFNFADEFSTTSITDGYVSEYRFNKGMYSGTKDADGNYGYQLFSNQFRPDVEVDANGNSSWLTWSEDGRLLEDVVNAQGTLTHFEYNTNETLSSSEDTEGRFTHYTYADSNNERQPTQVEIRDTDDTTVLQRQVFEYHPDNGRLELEQTIDSITDQVLREVRRLYYQNTVDPEDADGNPYTSQNGNGLVARVIEYGSNDVEDVTTNYFYDEFGRLIQTNRSTTLGACDRSFNIYDAAGNTIVSICNYDNSGSAPTNVTEALALYNPAFPDVNRITVHEYDSLGRRFSTTVNAGSDDAQTTLTVYDALNRVVRTISNYVAHTSIPNPYTANRELFNHGADNTENLITETLYDARGLIQQQIDVLGNITLLGYDAAGRQVRVVRNASNPQYNVSGDPTLEGYIGVEDADLDLITTYAYDANGNLVRTTDELGNVTFTVYDQVNRVAKTIRGAKNTATVELDFDDIGYIASNDPRSEEYVPSSRPDRDIIIRNEYDWMGRLSRTWDSLGNSTLFIYDSLGRQVITVHNPKPSARIDLPENHPNYAATNDPRNPAYIPSESPDEDIIAQIVYGSDNRVLYTVDSNGARTWTGYDDLGRPIRTVRNALGTATDNGMNDPRSSSYVASTEPDEDLISRIAYDLDGRVMWTEDTIGRRTWFAYDDLGRQIRRIVNAVGTAEDGGSNDPRSSSYGASSLSDRDLITSTVYDSAGRVMSTIDEKLRNETRYEYDQLGRQIRVITNYTNGIVDINTPDEDLIQTTSYDLAGRVIQVTNPAGRISRYVYDQAGRRIRMITNFQDGIYNPDYPDEDIITETVFNKAGQVIQTIDPRGTASALSYDAVGRRLTVTQAANSSRAATSYTCYNKAGQVERTIRNWINNGISPDARDEEGNWLFDSTNHGIKNDLNLINEYHLDRLGRVIEAFDPLGNMMGTIYFKDGRINSTQDSLGLVTINRYDGIRRLVRAVQNYQTINPIAYAIHSTSGPSYGVEFVDPDGSNNHGIYVSQGGPSSSDSVDPAWSPIGDQIVTASTILAGTPLRYGILTYDIGSLGPWVPNDNFIVASSGRYSNPSWSSSSTVNRVVFVYTNNSNVSQIYTGEIGTSNETQLTSLGNNISPQWSPDGTQIVFVSDRNGNNEIYVMDADGSNQTRLTNNSASDVAPQWSPDGTQIVFVSDRNGNNEIYVMDADGSNQTRLTNNSASDVAPQWSPDGTRIAFISNRDGHDELYVMDDNGANQFYQCS